MVAYRVLKGHVMQHAGCLDHARSIRMQQVLFGRYLATWIAQCGAASVRLQLDAYAEDGEDWCFVLVIWTPSDQYGAATDQLTLSLEQGAAFM